MLVRQSPSRGGVPPAIRRYDVVEHRWLRGNVDAPSADRREKFLGTDALVDASVGCTRATTCVRHVYVTLRLDGAQISRDGDWRGNEPEDRVIQNCRMCGEPFGHARTGALNDGPTFSASTTSNDVAGDELIAPARRNNRGKAPQAAGVDQLNGRRGLRGRHGICPENKD
jgi:hypothetical protein